MTAYYRYILFSGILALLLFSACRKEEFITDSSAQLSFSQDTIMFDTVFTSVGSTTAALKVYNTHGESIRISRIKLEGGVGSPYSMNVDGLNGTEQTDIEILPGDSIYIFVEVTIDPTNGNLPFIVEDSIRFETNGNIQHVLLNAFGQDAYFHGRLNTITALEPNEVWNNDKPHVLYGIVAVDSSETLTINAGTQIYAHYEAGLYIYKGTVNILGELGNEVVFQGDRLEPSYANIPGQWGIQVPYQYNTTFGVEQTSIALGGIYFFAALPSTINYAVVKNGGIGIQVDSTGTSGWSVTLNNTKVYNMAAVGLLGRDGSIKGTNLLVSNCGSGCVNLAIGGKYQMDNCTFGDYWSNGNRTTPTFALSNWYEGADQTIYVRPLTQCLFRNCIMYGANALLDDYSEFIVDVDYSQPVDFLFQYCLVDTDEDMDVPGDFENMVNGQSPAFCAPYDNIFKLSSNSSAMQGGTFVVGLPDINGVSNGEWKGCYDFSGDCNP